MPFQPEEKWDVHTHTTLSPQTYEKLERFAANYAHFVRVRAHSTKPCCAEMVNGRGELQRVIEDDAYHGPSRIEACDRHGVTVQVLSPTPMMIPDYVDNAQDAVDICKILNDDNNRLVQQFPDRFVAMGALPMRFPDKATEEMRRLKALGFKGIEINSNVNGEDLDATEFFPVFQAADELGMAIFVHPWAGFMFPTEETLKARMKATRNWRPWLAAMPLETALAFDSLVRGRVHERLPGLRVLYAHGGGTFPALLGRLEHGSYCRPDLFGGCSPADMWSTVKDCGIYTDTLTHSPWALKMLVDLMGSRYLALGSDYPYPLGEIDPFDACTAKDPKGNDCPYHRTKNIYPGHLIEHLPTEAQEMEAAWEHFHWLPRDNSDGQRALPLLTTEQKQNMLHRTAKDWLGIDESDDQHASRYKRNTLSTGSV